MRIEINIDKKHFFLLTGLFALLVCGVFVYAYGGTQPSVMGHSFGEIEGVTPNCLQTSCPELPTSWGAEASTSRYAARSYTSDNFGGIGLASFCRWDGSSSTWLNCPTSSSGPVTGSIIAGGRGGYGGIVGCASLYGGATCSGGNLVCPSSTTARQTGKEYVDDGFGGSIPVNWYVCVKN